MLPNISLEKGYQQSLLPIVQSMHIFPNTQLYLVLSTFQLFSNQMSKIVYFVFFFLSNFQCNRTSFSILGLAFVGLFCVQVFIPWLLICKSSMSIRLYSLFYMNKILLMLVVFLLTWCIFYQKNLKCLHILNIVDTFIFWFQTSILHFQSSFLIQDFFFYEVKALTTCGLIWL